RRRHTRCLSDWSSDVCSSDLKPARGVSLDDDERPIARNYFLLTMKPTIYAANVNEVTLNAPDENEYVKQVREIAAAEASECVVKIGRASCRERGEMVVDGGAV